MSFKNQLQEFCQKNQFPLPQYSVIEQGPPHCRQFKATVTLGKQKYTSNDWASSKKQAEIDIAQYVLNNKFKIKTNSIDSADKRLGLPSTFHVQKLQEYMQKVRAKEPKYDILQQPDTPSHLPQFHGTVKIYHPNIISLSVKPNDSFSNKKLVQQALAKLALDYIAQQNQTAVINRQTPVDKYDHENIKINLSTKHRNYQEELYYKSMRDDIICYLPTGAGKTLISCLTIKRMYQKNPNKYILFIVDRIPLVYQQSKVIERETGLKVIGFCGDTFDKNKLDSKVDVIVIIGSLYLNLLATGILSIKDVSLVVFDEAHHITGEHPFTVLIRDHIKRVNPSLQPKIMGLTASPIAGCDFYDTLAKLKSLIKLSGANIRMPLDNLKELESYVTPHSIEIIELPLTNIDKYIANIFKILEKYHEDSEDFKDSKDLIPGEHILYNPEAKDIILDITNLRSLLTALFEQYQLFGCFYYENVKIIDITDIVKFVLDLINIANIPKIIKDEIMAVSNDIELSNGIHDKFSTLIRILNQYSTGSESRTIVFVETKESANLLFELILNKFSNSNLIPAIITGHGTRKDFGMSVSQQMKSIADFRTKQANILIATSVVEEGFDVPECNVVIRLDAPNTVTALIQSRGRLRFKDNKFIAIVKSDEVGKYNKLIQQEEHIKAAVLFLQKKVYPNPSLLKNILDVNKTAIQSIQEYSQKFLSYGITLILYWQDISNIDEFKVILYANNIELGVGKGSKKQIAKENAAIDALYHKQNFLNLLWNY